jgi:DeoR/GlpR family transcriptional regulator of sugar metabolism
MATLEKSKVQLRRQNIIEQLGREGMVRVVELSKQYGASEVTIRNDLAELEQLGFLERIPGGALLSLRNYHSMDFQQRKEQHSQEKIEIAKAVSTLIHDGQSLIIGSGTTTYYVALELKRLKDLKILTNSFSVAAELGTIPTFQVILLGGSYNAQYQFTYGEDALAQLKKYKADNFILALDGISLHGVLTTYHAEEAELTRLMIERSKSTIIAADHSKIGRESFTYLGSIKQADYLVTDKQIDKQLLKKMEMTGISILQG